VENDRGCVFLYQGEELGLEDGTVDRAAAADPIAARAGDHDAGRDGARTPMPWAPTRGLGFTTAEHAWLPLGGRTAADTVKGQEGRPLAPLERHRRLIAAAHGLVDLADGALIWLDSGWPVVAYRRGACAVVANLSDEPRLARLPSGRWQCAYSSLGEPTSNPGEGTWSLAAREAMILRRIDPRACQPVQRRRRTE
jgi:alpha-glucosidase